jgi:hypothetical protein
VDEVEHRTELARRCQQLVCHLLRPGAEPDDPAHLLEVQPLGEGRPGRDGQEGEEAVQVVGRLAGPAVVSPHHLGRLLERPEHQAPDHGVDRMKLERQRSDDAEVPSAAPDRPPTKRVRSTRLTRLG